MAVVRTALAAVSWISHWGCGACAEILFRWPPRFEPTRKERAILNQARGMRLSHRGGRIAVWLWGEGPCVLLAHGWGSRAGRLASFVVPLVEAGFSVAAFDAPGHGDSTGRLATLPDFVDALRRVARRFAPAALLGHSLGAAACALGLRRGVAARAAVLLSPPADPGAYTLRYARRLRLPAAAAAEMRRRLEARYRTPLDTYRLVGRGPDVPSLIVHDHGDRRVPLADGMAIAASWPAARIRVTRGLGHHRILRDPGVAGAAVAFIREVLAGQSTGLGRIAV